MPVQIFVLFGMKLVKTFKIVLLIKATSACISLPLKAFFQLKDSTEFIASVMVLL